MDAAVYNAVRKINPLVGARMTRVMSKAYFGQPISITSLGDSILEGTTVTSGGGVLGVDDCLSLARSGLAAAYPSSTVTMHNRAVSGRTMAMQVKSVWATALADNADVYILSSGKNELAAYSLAAPGALEGQSFASSGAMLEAKVAELRAAQPNAVIIIMTSNPYAAASTALNGYQTTWDTAAVRIAYLYGCEIADGHKAFTALGAWDSLLSDGVHPNKAGHALLGKTLLSVFPLAWTPAYAWAQLGTQVQAPSSTYPPLPNAADRVGLPWRHTRYGMQGITAVAGVNYAAKLQKTGAINGVGADHFTGTGPYTSSTAGDTIICTIPGNEAFLDLVMGGGQGTVAIYVDGAPLTFNGSVVGNVDLSLRANGKLLHLTDQSAMGKLGWHTVAVTLISGSMTFNGCYYTAGRSQWINQDSPSVVAASMGSTTTLSSLPGGNGIAIANGGSLTVKFVGTGIGTCWWRTATGGVAYFGHPTIDGVDQGARFLGNNDTNQVGYGSQILVSGLTYALHTLVLPFQATGLYIGGFYPVDEQAHLHPNQMDGWAGAAEVVHFGETFPASPSMSGDAGVSFGSLTGAGFTNGATAGQWKAVSVDSTAGNALAY